DACSAPLGWVEDHELDLLIRGLNHIVRAIKNARQHLTERPRIAPRDFTGEVRGRPVDELEADRQSGKHVRDRSVLHPQDDVLHVSFDLSRGARALRRQERDCQQQASRDCRQRPAQGRHPDYSPHGSRLSCPSLPVLVVSGGGPLSPKNFLHMIPSMYYDTIPAFLTIVRKFRPQSRMEPARAGLMSPRLLTPAMRTTVRPSHLA